MPSEPPRWLIVELKGQDYAIAASAVQELVPLPRCIAIPGLPSHMRGCMKLREEVMPLVDARKRVGVRSMEEETEDFCSILAQREQDHRKWLAELEASVLEGRKFGLTTDPHRCAFGKWYDSYRSDNPTIAWLLRQFDRPHKRIHAIAAEVAPLQANGEAEEARKIIDRTRGRELAAMVRLFAEMKSALRESNRECAVVIAGGGRRFAASVDRAVSMESLEEGSIEEIPLQGREACDDLVRRSGRRKGEARPVLILEHDRLMHAAGARA